MNVPYALAGARLATGPVQARGRHLVASVSGGGAHRSGAGERSCAPDRVRWLLTALLVAAFLALTHPAPSAAKGYGLTVTRARRRAELGADDTPTRTGIRQLPSCRVGCGNEQP